MKLNENAATQCKNAIETIKHFAEMKRNGELLSKIDREQLIDVIKWLLSYGNHVKNYKTEEKINEWLKVAAKLLHDKNAFDLFEKKTSGIHINPENKGKFNATKKRTGKSTEELTHSKNPLTKKRAVFAQNAAKWSKGKTNESALEKRIREGIENLQQNQERPSWEEILKRINDAGVNQAIEKQQQNNSPENLADTYTFQIGKYTFNSAQHRLDGPNGSKYLSGRISDMLLMFCEHLNQTISTKSILQAIWGTDDFAAQRNMNVYMVELKKLFADDPNVNLMTLRGVGYRLEVKTGVEEAKTNEKTNQMKKFFRDNNGELHCIYLYTINKKDTTIEYAECLDDNNHWLLGKYKYINRPWQRFDYEQAIQNLIQQFPEEWQENASREVINQLSESIDSLYAEDYDEDYEIVLYDVINKCGWSVSNSYAVESKTTGQTGTRFELVNDENACTEEELKNRISQEIPEDRTVFSTGTHRYAPEIKRISVVLLSNE